MYGTSSRVKRRSAYNFIKSKLDLCSTEVLPKPSFQAVFKDDYSIGIVDQKIKKYLLSLVNDQDRIKSLIAEHQEIIDNPNSSDNKKQFYLNKVEQLNRELFYCTNKVLYNNYVNDTSSLINEYNKSLRDKVTVITEYLDLASKYVEVNVSKLPETVNYCSACGELLDERMMKDDGIIECHNCDTILGCRYGNRVIEDKTYCDITKQPQNYDDVVKKILDTFQGKNFDVDYRVIIEIDDYIKKYNLFTFLNDPDKIKYKDTGKVEGTSVESLNKILDKLGRKDESKNVQYIGHMCLGWKLRDISHLEPFVLKLYYELRANFVKHYEGRKTPNNFFIYKILKELNVPCDSEDFSLPKSDDCINNLKDIWDVVSKGVDFD